MDSITALIKNEIIRQYKSVLKFSEESGIPYSTLSNALSKGIGGSSYDTVVKICHMLGIKQTYDSDIVLFNTEFHDIYTKLTKLDEQGVHTIRTILDVEYARCTDADASPMVKAFNGIGYASKADEQEDIRALVQQAKKHE